MNTSLHVGRLVLGLIILVLALGVAGWITYAVVHWRMITFYFGVVTAFLIVAYAVGASIIRK